MKLKNILSMVCFLCLVFSCSMEDDVLNGQNGNAQIPTIEEGDVYVGFSIDRQSLAATKANTTQDPDKAEKEIKSCSIILLDGDNVLIADDNVHVNSDNVIVKTAAGKDTVKYMVKVKTPSPYKVMVVANSDKTFAGLANLTAINNVLQDDKDALVKVGTGNVVFESGFKGYTSTVESSNHPVMVDPVTVSQLSARIDLNSFNVVEFIENSDPVDVVVKSVTLTNLNTTIYTGNTYVATPQLETETYTFENGGFKVYDATASEDKRNIALTEIPRFYTFSNQLENSPITMSITYTVGDIEYTTKTPYVINKPGNSADHEYVKSSWLYKVNVDMSLRSGITFTTNVLDWVDVNLDVEF
ncbi:hypothetical protein [Parabacteroides sp.]